MVEPRRRCYSLPAVDLRKKAVGGIIYVTVLSANKLSKSSLKGSPSQRLQNPSSDKTSEDYSVDNDLQTFVEVELGELTRKTNEKSGSSPKWDSTFNMVMHEESGTLRFHLYECNPCNVKYDYLASCEIKVLIELFLSIVFAFRRPLQSSLMLQLRMFDTMPNIRPKISFKILGLCNVMQKIRENEH